MRHFSLAKYFRKVMGLFLDKVTIPLWQMTLLPALPQYFCYITALRTITVVDYSVTDYYLFIYYRLDRVCIPHLFLAVNKLNQPIVEFKIIPICKEASPPVPSRDRTGAWEIADAADDPRHKLLILLEQDLSAWSFARVCQHQAVAVLAELHVCMQKWSGTVSASGLIRALVTAL